MLHIHTYIVTGDFQSHSLIWYVNARTKFQSIRWNIFCFVLYLPIATLHIYKNIDRTDGISNSFSNILSLVSLQNFTQLTEIVFVMWYTGHTVYITYRFFNYNWLIFNRILKFSCLNALTNLYPGTFNFCCEYTHHPAYIIYLHYQ